MTINEIIFMQIRIVRLFCVRYALKVKEVNRIFVENKIYEFIENGYDTYHCGGDELVFNDVRDILLRNGAIG